MGIDLVCGEDGNDELGLVVVALGEQGAQRSVAEPCSQDGFGAWPSLTLEESAGHFPNCVRLLCDVDGQWQEIDALAWVFVSGGGGKQYDIAVSQSDGSACLIGEPSRFERHQSSANFDIK